MITEKQFYCLIILAVEEALVGEGPTYAEIAEVLACDVSEVQLMVEDLVERGFASHEDGRCEITEKTADTPAFGLTDDEGRLEEILLPPDKFDELTTMQPPRNGGRKPR